MIVVIGYGNTLCGDDGIGPYIAERLSGEMQSGDIDFWAVRQLTPELAEPISRADAAIFIDTCVGATPGQIGCYELTLSPEPNSARSGAFTHHVHAVGLLESAYLLYGKCPPAYLYGVAGQAFSLGAGFSPSVEAALPCLIEAVKERIALCTNTALLKAS